MAATTEMRAAGRLVIIGRVTARWVTLDGGIGLGAAPGTLPRELAKRVHPEEFGR